MTSSLAQRLAAEALGTAFLLATVVGSGIMGDMLAGGNEAVALLANTIATGAILAVLIMVFGPVSGAHFNPAVSMAFLIRREIEPGAATLYMLVQIAGAIAGVFTAHAMFDLEIVQASEKLRTGPAQWFSEGVPTFGLVGFILGTVRYGTRTVAATVGLYITAAYWFTASTSFANPAVTIGRTLTNTFSGIYPAHAPGFIVAQLVGAAAAVLVMFRVLGGKRDVKAEPERQTRSGPA